MVIALQSRRILGTYYGVGSQHDFGLLKESKVRFRKGSTWIGDLGYIGLSKLHKKVELPYKRTHGVELGKLEKDWNREHSRRRVVIEHIIGGLKIFKIISEKYRNRRERFELRFNLIASIFNFERKLKKYL